MVRSLSKRVSTVLVLLFGVAQTTSCSLTGPSEPPVPVQATVASAIGNAQGIYIEVRLKNTGTSVVYAPKCFDVERRIGSRWASDKGLSGACSGEPLEPIEPGMEASRAVVLMHSALPVDGGAVVRISFVISETSEFPFRPFKVTTTAPLRID